MSRIKPKVLVTGHMGFIGAWVAYKYYLSGWDVYGLDNKSSYGERLYDKANLTEIFVDEIIADVSEPSVWMAWASSIKPELVIHLAGQAIVPRAFREPFSTFRTNTLGTLAVLDVFSKIDACKAVLCITSDKVYENIGSLHPYVETDLLGGKDIYSVSKSATELVAKAYAHSHLGVGNLSIQTVRLGNVVGGGDWSHNRLLPDLIHAVEHGKAFKVRYLEATRPFQHVSDVVSGIFNISIGALKESIDQFNSWNLGPKNNTWASVKQVVDIVSEYYGEIEIQSENELYKEDMNLMVSVDKYSEVFAPPRDTSLESLHRAIKWYKSFYKNEDVRKLIVQDLY